MFKKLCFFFLCSPVVLSLPVFSQVADTVNIGKVEIHGDRNHLLGNSTYTTTFDSVTKSFAGGQSLATLLTIGSPVFIKSYGQGGAATLSVRGTEARHNAVIWNGFNINSASLGLSDLSIIPAFITDEIMLLHGGSSTVNGNSALGSSLILSSSDPDFMNFSELSLQAGMGSFGNENVAAKLNIGNKKLQSSTRIFGNKAENNFTFTNTTHRLHPEKKQSNAAFNTYGLLQDFSLNTGNRQRLNAGVWYQSTRREIPPLMTTEESHASQGDSVLRIYANYKILKNKSSFKIGSAWFNEYQYYDDPLLNYHLKYLVTSFMNEVEWRYYLSEKWTFNSGISFSYASGDFKEYHSKKHRTTTSIFAGTLFEPVYGWKITTGIRGEFTNFHNPPPAPFADISGNLYKKKVYFHSHAGINYNLPAMNDLYWVPGGNAKLLPEHDISYECGLLAFPSDSVLPEIKITAYYSTVKNWIRWQPNAGGIHTPVNLKEVTAKGLETSVAWNKKIGRLNCNTSVAWVYTRSAVTKSDAPQSYAIIDKQIPYVPEHCLNGNLILSYHGFTLFYQHSLTGITFTTTDNTSAIPSYHIANAGCSKSIKIRNCNSTAFLNVMNLFDTNYQVIAYRPMPGRWFMAGLNIQITKT